MILDLPVHSAVGYRSASQQARVMTEAWMKANMFCPACTSNHLDRTKTGTPVVDFVCSRCESQYQLKAMSKPLGRKVVDAAYDVMIRAVMKDYLPHFLFLSYIKTSSIVNNLLLIPNFCFSKSAIERRKPLRPTARRAGWVGCNILLDSVPPEGRIDIIHSGSIIPKFSVRKSFRDVQSFKNISVKKRGWTLDVLTALRTLGKNEFIIEDAYSFEKILSEKHPENLHVRAKIRQQLQVLRDLGYLQFVKRGYYRWLKR